MSRAQWAQKAVDLTLTPSKVPAYLTVGQLSDATGLSDKYLLDPLTRAEITNPDNPRGALCRPAAKFGDTPMWSHEQLAEYRRRVDARSKTELETVTPAEARERRLYSTAELAEVLDVHDQTLRRAQNNDVEYPPAVARRVRVGNPGPPDHVRSLDAVLKWAHRRGYAVNTESVLARA